MGGFKKSFRQYSHGPVNDKLFIPQSVLDNWIESGKVVFNDNRLTLTREKKTYTLTSAVRFLSLLDGEDKAKLLGRLRTLDKLTEMGAEHMSDSVLLGDTAYQVQEGFIAVVLADDAEVTTQPAPAAQAAPATPPAAAPVAAATPQPAPVQAAGTPAPEPVQISATPATESQDADAELLTKFLLNNLNF